MPLQSNKPPEPIKMREAMVICFDSSLFMKNQDYFPSRWEAQYEAIKSLIGDNPTGNDVSCGIGFGIVDMAGLRASVVTPLNMNTNLVHNALSKCGVTPHPKARYHLVDGLNLALMMLKNCSLATSLRRLVVFCGSPVSNNASSIEDLGRLIRDYQITLNVIHFGDADPSSLSLLFLKEDIEDHMHECLAEEEDSLSIPIVRIVFPPQRSVKSSGSWIWNPTYSGSNSNSTSSTTSSLGDLGDDESEVLPHSHPTSANNVAFPLTDRVCRRVMVDPTRYNALLQAGMPSLSLSLTVSIPHPSPNSKQQNSSQNKSSSSSSSQSTSSEKNTFKSSNSENALIPTPNKSEVDLKEKETPSSQTVVLHFPIPSQRNRQIVVEFRAGRMHTSPPNLVTASHRKGQFALIQIDNSVLQVIWRSRVSRTVELDIVLRPGEASWFRVPLHMTKARVYVLQMSPVGRKFFFWMQYPDESKDELHSDIINGYLGKSSKPIDPLAQLLSSMDSGDIQHLLKLYHSGGIPTSSSNTPRTPHTPSRALYTLRTFSSPTPAPPSPSSLPPLSPLSPHTTHMNSDSPNNQHHMITPYREGNRVSGVRSGRVHKPFVPHSRNNSHPISHSLRNTSPTPPSPLLPSSSTSPRYPHHSASHRWTKNPIWETSTNINNPNANNVASSPDVEGIYPRTRAHTVSVTNQKFENNNNWDQARSSESDTEEDLPLLLNKLIVAPQTTNSSDLGIKNTFTQTSPPSPTVTHICTPILSVTPPTPNPTPVAVPPTKLDNFSLANTESEASKINSSLENLIVLTPNAPSMRVRSLSDPLPEQPSSLPLKKHPLTHTTPSSSLTTPSPSSQNSSQNNSNAHTPILIKVDNGPTDQHIKYEDHDSDSAL